MTFKVNDRIFETSTTVGTGAYALLGAQTGFQSFSVLLTGSTCPYFATDDINWEVGIGTWTSGPSTLARTTILASSNGGAAVNWGGGITQKIRCGLPAGMAMARALSKSVAGSVDVTLTADEQLRQIITLTGALTGNINVIVDATPWRYTVINNTTGGFTLTFKTVAGTGILLTQTKAKDLVCDGTNIVDANSDSGLPVGALIDYGGTVIPGGYLACDGSNVSRTTYAALFGALMRSATATITIASPGVVTWNAHGLSNGDVVKFTTTGALPTGLIAGTTYFARNVAANTLELSATETGSSINTSGTQSGTHTAIHAPHGDGDGSTTFGVPDSRRRATVGRGGSATATLGARLGATGGEETHVLSVAELASHTHSYSSSGTAGSLLISGGANFGTGSTGSAGSDTAHNNIQPSLIVTKIIKT